MRCGHEYFLYGMFARHVADICCHVERIGKRAFYDNKQYLYGGIIGSRGY